MIDRADRLGAAMLVLGLVHEPATAAVAALEEVPLLTDDQWEAWRDLDNADLALTHECLRAQFETRAREWEALERFLAAWPHDPITAAQAALDLGWGWMPDEDRSTTRRTQ